MLCERESARAGDAMTVCSTGGGAVCPPDTRTCSILRIGPLWGILRVVLRLVLGAVLGAGIVE